MRPTTTPVVSDPAVHLPRAKKLKFLPRIRAWKHRDAAIANQFQEALQKHGMSTAQSTNDTTDHVESVWSCLKFPNLEAAIEVSGLSKNHQWRTETWW